MVTKASQNIIAEAELEAAELVEHEAAPEFFVSGLGKIDMLSGGVARGCSFTWTTTRVDGVPQRMIGLRLIAPLSAIPNIARKLEPDRRGARQDPPVTEWTMKGDKIGPRSFDWKDWLYAFEHMDGGNGPAITASSRCGGYREIRF